MALKFTKMVKETANQIGRAISSFGKITSVASDGRKVNVSNDFNGEARDLMVVGPYGISSCGLDGLFVQIGVNDNDNNVAVGVFDPSKPTVKSGEIIIYNKAGDQIKLSASGGIFVTGNITFGGNVTINGNLTTTGGIVRLE